MDYRDEVFLTVAERLSFSKAAEDLFISQPAVTKHIKTLEQQHNMRLFERKGHHIRLTEAGQISYSHLKAIQQQYKEMEYSLGQLQKVFKGRIRLGVSSTIAQYVIPQLLAAFYKTYPQIRLSMYSSNSQQAEQMLIENKVDMILVENAKSDTHLKYTAFMEDELIAVSYARSSLRKNISLNTLINTPIVLREKGSGTLEVIRHALHSKHISLDMMNIVLHLGSTESIKRFLLNFDGMAIISARAIDKELENKTLQTHSLQDVSMCRAFRYATKQGQSSQAVQLFTQFLTNYNF